MYLKNNHNKLTEQKFESNYNKIIIKFFKKFFIKFFFPFV